MLNVLQIILNNLYGKEICIQSQLTFLNKNKNYQAL